MISFSPVTSGSYYTEGLQKDGNRLAAADNYYTKGNSPSEWQGSGAWLTGKLGEKVEANDFGRILEGNLPNLSTGKDEQMPRDSRMIVNQKTGEKEESKGRMGWDMTMSAPKSVSLVALVGQDQNVISAHRFAVSETIKYLEKHGAQTRIRDGKETQIVATGNMLAAVFHHEAARDNMPNLHSHVVVMNATYDKNSEKWRALSNEQLLKLRSGADQIYKQELANNLNKAGYQAQIVKDGEHTTIEIKGISKSNEIAFSTRSAAIDKWVEKRDSSIKEKLSRGEALSEKERLWGSYNTSQKTDYGTLATRQAKDELPKDKVLLVWKDKARENNLDIDKVVSAAANSRISNDKAESQSFKNAQRSLKEAVADISKEKASFTEKELIENVIEKSAGNCSVKDIESAIKEMKGKEDLIARPYNSLTTPKNIQNQKTNYKAAIEKRHETGNINKLTEQIKIDYGELRAAKSALGSINYQTGKDKNMFGIANKSRTQTYDGNIKSLSIGIMKDRYKITSKGVFISRAGLFNIKNAIAHKLSDQGKKNLSDARRDLDNSKTLAGKVMPGIRIMGAHYIKLTGDTMATYHKVGIFESATVRAANALQKSSEKQRLTKDIKRMESAITAKKFERDVIKQVRKDGYHTEKKGEKDAVKQAKTKEINAGKIKNRESYAKALEKAKALDNPIQLLAKDSLPSEKVTPQAQGDSKAGASDKTSEKIVAEKKEVAEMKQNVVKQDQREAKETSKEAIKEPAQSKDDTKDSYKNPEKEKEAFKDTSVESSKTSEKEVSKEASKETSKEAIKEPSQSKDEAIFERSLIEPKNESNSLEKTLENKLINPEKESRVNNMELNR